MAVVQRNVVLQGQKNGDSTIDLPLTSLENIEDSAEKLNTDAESATNPVYFSNGIPASQQLTL